MSTWQNVLSVILVCSIISLVSSPTAHAAALPNLSDVQRQAKQLPTCCDVLAYFLPGEVSAPVTPAYTVSLLSYWSQQEQQVLPACVVTAKSAQDVATAVHVLNITSQILKNDGCNFAVRSGG